MTSYTPNLNLAKQDTGAQDWGTVLNENFDKIDAGVAGKGDAFDVGQGLTLVEGGESFEKSGESIFIDSSLESLTAIGSCKKLKGNLIDFSSGVITEENSVITNITGGTTGLGGTVPANSAPNAFGKVFPVELGKTYTFYWYNTNYCTVNVIQLDSPVEFITDLGTAISSGDSVVATKAYMGIWLVPNYSEPKSYNTSIWIHSFRAEYNEDEITCNNGTLKVRHQSGLPMDYQPYEYITASGTQWLDTGVTLASTDIVEAEFQNSARTGYGALYGVFALGDSSAFYANGTYYGYDVSNGKVDTGISVDTTWHTLRFDYVNGVITLDGNDTTYTPFVFENSKNNYLFSRYYGGSYGYGFKGSCKRFKVIRNNEVICDLIPVMRLSDNAVGMYDLAQSEFRENIGTGDFTASNSVNDLEVYVDGTAEIIGKLPCGKNLFDRTRASQYYKYNNSGVETLGTAWDPAGPYIVHSAKMPCEENTAYTISLSRQQSFSPQLTAQFWDSEGAFIDYAVISNGSGSRVDTVTTPLECAFISFNFCETDEDIQLEKGSSATAYEAYQPVTGGYVSCQPLLGAGDYKDTQEILTGAITRNVRIKILNGTENWTTLDQYSRTSIQITNMKNSDSPRTLVAYCNYFENLHNQESIGSVTAGQFYLASPQRVYFHISQATTADFKEWLASQYAAGTPVILVYPLSSPTTESVTAQTLEVSAGDTIIPYGVIDDLTIEADISGPENDVLSTSSDVALTDFSNISSLGKLRANSWGAPSNQTTTLTIASSGAQFTAPANGWFYAEVTNSGSSSGNLQLTKNYNYSVGGTLVSGATAYLMFPCGKGDKITVSYFNLQRTPTVKFIYAKGEANV